MPCPICEQGTLDGDWRTRATNLLAESDLLDQHRRAVRTGLDQARRKAVGLIAAPPKVLGQGIVQLESQAQAARAWMAWGSLPADDRALVEHLRSSYQPLLSAVATWKNDAASAEAQQEATWQPLAVAISGWLGRYQQALTDDQLRYAWIQPGGRWLKSRRPSGRSGWRRSSITPVRSGVGCARRAAWTWVTSTSLARTCDAE